jgi:hypothetical protein
MVIHWEKLVIMVDIFREGGFAPLPSREGPRGNPIIQPHTSRAGLLYGSDRIDQPRGNPSIHICSTCGEHLIPHQAMEDRCSAAYRLDLALRFDFIDKSFGFHD